MPVSAAVIIPFRDRGRDPLRSANLRRVLEHWKGFGYIVHVVSDGRSKDEQFNRSRAYNIGAAITDADVLVYAESDMLVPYDQVEQAIMLASAELGLVVPFSEYRALISTESELVRAHHKSPYDCDAHLIMLGGHSIGAVNVVSRQTLTAIGQWDEGFEGSWWDDKAMERAFSICAGPTRWVDGPAFHLWHLPAHTGDHLTDDDRIATDHNAKRWEQYEKATTPEEIRRLTNESTHS